MAVSIRRATSSDASELARLRWEFRTGDRGAQALDDFARDFQAWLDQALGTGRWVVVVADAGGGTLVGCALLESVAKVPIPGRIERTWGYVTNVYVAPSHRRAGLGARMIEAVVAAARERNEEFILLWPSEEAVSLYVRAGFREVSEVHGRPGDFPPLELRLP